MSININKSQIKKVLLIDIPTYKVTLSENHRLLYQKKMSFQTSVWERRTNIELRRPAIAYSRGLLSIAAKLEQSGFAVIYLNYSDPKDSQDIVGYCQHADVVGIMALTPTIHIASKICRDAKKVNHKIITIVGGPHIFAVKEEVLEQNPDIDFAMIGESEDRFPEFLRSIKYPNDVGGLIFRDDDGEVRISDANVSPVIVQYLPMPAYHMLRRPLAEYSHNINTSRGCPYNCCFCSERASWHSPSISANSIDHVVNELEFLNKALPHGTLVHFSDAIFNIDENRTKEFSERLANANLALVFSADTRTDLIKTRKNIMTLAKAGFVYLRMGFESFHNNILEYSRKNNLIEAQSSACEIIRSAQSNIAILAYKITGLPGETRETSLLDAEQIKKLISDELVDVIANKILVPYPGSEYAKNSSKYGIHIQTFEWSKYDRLSFPVYGLENLSADDIYSEYMFQESALVDAYTDKLDNKNISKDINYRVGYTYPNYAQKHE